jgi:hypothetical protein
MTHFGIHWIKKTRTPHVCGWCEKIIESGSVAEHSSGIFDGGFWSQHLHPECAAAKDSLSYSKLEDGWCPGDFARGRTDDNMQFPPQFAPDYRGKNKQ